MCSAELEIEAPKSDVLNFYKSVGQQKGWNFDTEARAKTETSSLGNPRMWGLMNFTSKSGDFKSLTLIIPSDQHTGTTKTRLQVSMMNPPDRITFGVPAIQTSPRIKIDESGQNDKWKLKIDYLQYEGNRLEMKEMEGMKPAVLGDVAAGFQLARVRVHLERLSGERINDEYLKAMPTVRASDGKIYGPTVARIPYGEFYYYNREGLQRILVPVTGKSEVDYVYAIPASARAEAFIWPDMKPISLGAGKSIPSQSPEAQKIAVLAAEFLDKRRYQEAIHEAERALSIDPNNAKALETRAESYRMIGKFDEAIADATRLLQIEPNNTYTLKTRAEANRNKKNFREAIADADRALKIKSDDAFALRTRAIAYWGLGRYDEAIRDATRALEIEPKNAFALLYRGDSYRMKSRYEEAIRDADAALEIDPKNAVVLRMRAAAYQKKGEYDLAIRDAKKSLEIDPSSDFAKKILAEIEKEQGRSRVEGVQADASDWERALKIDTIKGYEDFLRQHPHSSFAEKAKGKIVDKEVSDILSKPHGQLPSSNKISEGGGRTYSVVNIHNNTQYNLTIRYSGPDSFKAVFSPNEKGSIEVLRGSYKVAASVDAPNVKDYAGDEASDGGNYEVEYYLVTTGPLGFSPPRIPRISYGAAPKFEPWPKKRIVSPSLK